MVNKKKVSIYKSGSIRWRQMIFTFLKFSGEPEEVKAPTGKISK
jgi:hypothetical protein